MAAPPLKPRIRIKFIGILILASVLPLCLALFAAQTLGYRYYRRAQGTLFETRAEHLASSLSLAVNEQVRSLSAWAALSDLAERVAAINTAAPLQTDEEFRAQITATEARWPALTVSSAELRGYLEHPLAAELRAFQSINPLFVEIFVTDAKGRLLAATEKTSDYWQADEEWWQRAWRAKFLAAEIEGIAYDASAGVYSVDVAVPIRDRAHPEAPPVGVIKGVLNASPLLSQGTPERVAGAPMVVLADGRILAEFSGAPLVPLQRSIAREAAQRLAAGRVGWMIAPIDGPALEIAGFAPLRVNDADRGIAPSFALVHKSAELALAPVQRQITLLTAVGAVFVSFFGLAGYWIAGKKIIEPVEALRAASREIASSVKIDTTGLAPRPLPALEPLSHIRTRDEIGDLARDFATMAARVLTYHERLEFDLAAKTAAIEADLEMAREFQEALMPHDYPKVPTDGDGDTICLDFHHIYQPASTVGGDFFDVLKLSDHRAGIFIADVMGHGARSALVTAILRALLQNLAFGTDDPAQFMVSLNQHFHAIVRESHETIFVSAFYIIIDTLTATAVCASAGHPSPFIANRHTGAIAPLLGSLRSNPALGLFADARYSKWSRPVQAGDLFLLFTDGVHEAQNAAGVEFGLERMRAVIAAGLKKSGHELGQAVVDAVHDFIAPAAAEDDICLVTVEVLATTALPPKMETVARFQAPTESASA
ncbi:MAG: SpoIIE family protein phosphatase [Chthoniobacteraceae bacterium]